MVMFVRSKTIRVHSSENELSTKNRKGKRKRKKKKRKGKEEKKGKSKRKSKRKRGKVKDKEIRKGKEEDKERKKGKIGKKERRKIGKGKEKRKKEKEKKRKQSESQFNLVPCHTIIPCPTLFHHGPNIDIHIQFQSVQNLYPYQNLAFLPLQTLQCRAVILQRVHERVSAVFVEAAQTDTGHRVVHIRPGMVCRAFAGNCRVCELVNGAFCQFLSELT